MQPSLLIDQNCQTRFQIETRSADIGPMWPEQIGAIALRAAVRQTSGGLSADRGAQQISSRVENLWGLTCAVYSRFLARGGLIDLRTQIEDRSARRRGTEDKELEPCDRPANLRLGRAQKGQGDGCKSTAEHTAPVCACNLRISLEAAAFFADADGRREPPPGVTWNGPS